MYTISAKLKQRCIDIMQTNMVSIKSLSELIGRFVAALPCGPFGTIFIKRLEMLKIKALAKSKRNYATFVRLTDKVKADIWWWIDRITDNTCPVTVLNLQSS